MNKINSCSWAWKAGALVIVALALQGCASTKQEQVAREVDASGMSYMGLQNEELPLLRDVTLKEEPGHVAALTITLDPPIEFSTQPWAYQMLWPTPHRLYVDAQGDARLEVRSEELAQQTHYLSLSFWPIGSPTLIEADSLVSSGVRHVPDVDLPITQYEVATWRYPGAQVILKMRNASWAHTTVANGPWQYTMRFFRPSEPGDCRQGDCLSLNFLRLNVGGLIELFNEFQEEYVVHADEKVRSMSMGIYVQDMPWDQALSLMVTTLNLEVRREGADIYLEAR